jgi:transcriptional regulator with XRE-family HTH domain
MIGFGLSRQCYFSRNWVSNAIISHDDSNTNLVTIIDIGPMLPLVSPRPKMKTRTEQAAFYQQIGTNIRKCRTRLNLSQNALGKLIGMTRTSLTNIENGRQHPPLHTFCEIVEKLKVDFPELLPRPLAPAELDVQVKAMVRRQVSTHDERAFIETGIGMKEKTAGANSKKKNLRAGGHASR